MTTPATNAANSVCPQCGGAFHCGRAASNERCWCAELPPVMSVPETKESCGGCLCPTCLAAAIEQRRGDPHLQQLRMTR